MGQLAPSYSFLLTVTCLAASLLSCGGPNCKCNETTPRSEAKEQPDTQQRPPAAAVTSTQEGGSLWGQPGAAAQTEQPTGEKGVLLRSLPIEPGDTKASVRQAYERYASDFARQPSAHVAEYYAFEKYGVSVYFDQNERVRRIKLEAPYEGDMLGVRLGDTSGQLRSKLGEPDPIPKKERELMDPFMSCKRYSREGRVYLFCLGTADQNSVRTIFVD